MSVVASPKLKQCQTSSLHLPLRASHQLHLSQPYYKDAPSVPLPSRVSSSWNCWTPRSVTSKYSPSAGVPCPPRITLAGILRDQKSPNASRRHADRVVPSREAVVATLPPVPKRPRHFQGKRARNKRPLHFPVPANRPYEVVQHGKLQRSPIRVFICNRKSLRRPDTLFLLYIFLLHP